MTTVTGISDHYGRAELVTLRLEEGAPVILDRRRVTLIAPDLPASPYHHEGLALPLDEAERIIRSTRASVAECCRCAIENLRSSLGADAVAIQESPFRELPAAVSQVLASRPLTYAADGMMYREELALQAAAAGLEVNRFPRGSDQFAAAARALRCPEPELAGILSGFGRLVGPPWRKEHRHAAAAALCVLVRG